ncbi:probable RNA helicase armi [Chironomus tepperi]|uniref:probable RNA helicase armi n=1 Tax=Chironomus tepperi TaxID=113505 RepID=UPI00391F76E5
MLRTLLSRFQANSSKLDNDSYQNRPTYIQESVPKKKVNERKDQITESHKQHKTHETTEFLGKIVFADDCDSDKNQIFTVSSNDIEYDVFLPDINWNAVVGDFVKCLAFVKINDEDGNKLEVFRMVPRKKSTEYARVTKVNDDHAIFDDRIILYKNTVKDSRIELYAEYKIEMIESDRQLEKSYSYRVTSIFEKMDSNIIGTGIVFENSPFKIYINQDEKKELGVKHIKIFNRSDKPACIKYIKIVPFLSENSDIISYEKNINFKLNPKIGQFKVFFSIQPRKIGKFFFYLSVGFNNFEEKYEFSVEIHKAYIVPGEKLIRSPRFVDVTISEHAIPNDIKEIDCSNFKEAKLELENLFPSLKEKLTPMNYLERMKLGLFLDEMAMEKSFASYHIDRTAFEEKGEYLKLTVKDVAEKRPSIIIGDKVIATDPTESNNDNNPIYEGYIHKVGNDSLFCKFHTNFHEQHGGKDYSVDFVFSRSVFRRQHHALEKFTSNNSLGYDFLFPNKKIAINEIQLDAEIDTEGNLIIGKRQQDWFYNDLNKYQKSAVVNVLRGENRPFPYIYFGCPGSGKTQTVIETILQIQKNLKSSKIIVATPSNSAANLILEMLLISDVLDVDNSKFLRIVSNNQVDKELIPDNLKKYCGTVSIASDNGNQSSSTLKNKNGILQNLTRSKIIEYQIIIATLNGIGNLMQMSFDEYFSHVIIDEAGQSIEAESIIPLTLLNSKNGQCVLSGDPKQLGPIAISIFAKTFNFSISMIERLLLTDQYYAQIYGPNKSDYDPKFVTKLIINYRSHPSVLKVYNDLFYNGELEGAVNDTDSIETLFLASIGDLLWKDINTKCGVIFVNVINGQNKRVQESCSWFNDQEVSGVMTFVKKCHAKNIPFKNIGILAPYALQVKKLKQQISLLNDSDLKVGTVEEFQGQERLIMIVSTVRTEQKHLKKDSRFGLGFLQCEKRINVAISRARALLVIFGKKSILEKDPNWKKLIDYTKENKTFVTENY